MKVLALFFFGRTRTTVLPVEVFEDNSTPLPSVEEASEIEVPAAPPLGDLEQEGLVRMLSHCTKARNWKGEK